MPASIHPGWGDGGPAGDRAGAGERRAAGTDQADTAESGQARQALDEIAFCSLAGAALLIALVGALRHRWDLAVAADG
ncbi:hypothetical protein GCM10017786_20020 [Amycolatopsis deserti]|uniref:Uncharacterized protein n=1 Tax=Amycolatopsis deserti TaxID=185696 RepID=A0ABQ3IPU0_9PSEU|nr:hypothetical protein [Amycolatopsis deserti]GHE88080.1 hypothetical protein GCM10017786_20020 [Amycolatopsis deserti]